MNEREEKEGEQKEVERKKRGGQVKNTKAKGRENVDLHEVRRKV